MLESKIIEIIRWLNWNIQLEILTKVWKTNCLQIGWVITQVVACFTPAILRIIVKEQVNWPELCIAKLCEVGRIRGEHQANNDTLQSTTRFSRGSLEFLMDVVEF